MKNTLLLIFLALCGCASITPEAQKVTVHSQMSNLLSGCERLGNVSATVSGWSKATWEDVYQQAKNDVRDKAHRELGADSIALVNSDKIGTSVTVQAIAFRCEK